MKLAVVINAVAFQLAWFAAVLGAAHGHPWLGPLSLLPVTAYNLTRSENLRGELLLLGAAGLLGFLFDSALIKADLFSPVSHLSPHPWSPPWMIGLWLNFALTLNVSLAWLKHRYLLAALFGAIGGPLAYLSGAKLGATASLPSGSGLLVLAAGWMTITPILVLMAEKTSRHGRYNQQSAPLVDEGE